MSKPKSKNPDQNMPREQQEVIANAVGRQATVAEINEVLDREYGWCGQSIPNLLKAILREQVAARLAR